MEGIHLERKKCTWYIRGEKDQIVYSVFYAMYVNAIFGGWRPGGATCVSAAAVAVRGRTGSAGTEGAVAQAAAAARGVRAATEGTLRRDFDTNHRLRLLL